MLVPASPATQTCARCSRYRSVRTARRGLAAAGPTHGVWRAHGDSPDVRSAFACPPGPDAPTLGRRPRRERHQLRPVQRGRAPRRPRARSTMTARISRASPLTGGRRLRLARLPAGGRARPALRLPGARAVGPHQGLRCNPAKLLLDPYATAVAGELGWRRGHGHIQSNPDRISRRDSARQMPLAVVTDPAFDWGDDRRPRCPTTPDGHLRDTCPWADMTHPEVPAGAAWNVRGPRVAADPRLPPRSRDHVGRVAAGAPLRVGPLPPPTRA